MDWLIFSLPLESYPLLWATSENVVASW